MFGKSGFRLTTAVLCVFAAALLLPVKGQALFAALTSSKQEVALNVKPGTVTSNVFFEDVSLSGLSVSEAIELIEKPVDTLKNTRFILKSPVSSDHTYEATAAELGISWNLNDIQGTLLDAELSGNLMERYKKAKDYQASPVTISMNLSVDQEEALALFEPLKDAWRQEPKNASVSMRTGKLVVTPSVNGVTYDFSEGVSKMAEDVLAGNIGSTGRYVIEATPVVAEPALTSERASGFSIIGAYTTYYGKPKREVQFNREVNVTVASDNMNGHTFAPGEQISALAMYGSVTLEGGYLPAGTINEGQHVDEIGGGICQVTTTLYNAGLLAELQIDYRRNHSQLVDYVPPSMDAMVYAAGNSDFKMTNNTSDYITIESWVDHEECSINVIIIGHEDHAPDHSVSFVSEVLELEKPEVVSIDDYSLPIGADSDDRSIKYQPDLYQSGTPKVKSRSYKITRDGDQIKQELLNSGDTYNTSKAVFYVAPDTYADVQVEWDPDKQEVSYTGHFYFLNGYPLQTDLNALSWSERSAFYDSMERELNKKGLHWPGYVAPTSATTEPPETTETKKPSKTKHTTEEETTEPTETDPPETEPSETEPPETNPPETDPPETDPPETDPPETDPPETDPPETDPPAPETSPEEAPADTDPAPEGESSEE